MTPLQSRVGDNSPQGIGYGGHATVNDRTGLYVGIVAIVISSLALAKAWSIGDLSDARSSKAELAAQSAKELAKSEAATAEAIAKSADDRTKATDRDLELIKYYLSDPDTRGHQQVDEWNRFRNERSKK